MGGCVVVDGGDGPWGRQRESVPPWSAGLRRRAVRGAPAKVRPPVARARIPVEATTTPPVGRARRAVPGAPAKVRPPVARGRTPVEAATTLPGGWGLPGGRGLPVYDLRPGRGRGEAAGRRARMARRGPPRPVEALASRRPRRERARSRSPSCRRSSLTSALVALDRGMIRSGKPDRGGAQFASPGPAPREC